MWIRIWEMHPVPFCIRMRPMQCSSIYTEDGCVLEALVRHAGQGVENQLLLHPSPPQIKQSW